MIYGKGGVRKNRNRRVRGRVGERQGMRVEGVEPGWERISDEGRKG